MPLTLLKNNAMDPYVEYRLSENNQMLHQHGEDVGVRVQMSAMSKEQGKQAEELNTADADSNTLSETGHPIGLCTGNDDGTPCAEYRRTTGEKDVRDHLCSMVAGRLHEQAILIMFISKEL